MNRIFMIIIVVLIILSGASTLPTCIDYLRAKSSESGYIEDLYKLPLPKTKDSYSISYDLDGGDYAEVGFKSNPMNYNLFTETFRLVNPVKTDYEFIGWTGSGISKPKMTIIIYKGSSGDLEFKANYRLNHLNTPVVSISDGVLTYNPVSFADKYDLKINSTIIKDIAFNSITLAGYTNYFSLGKNEISVRARATIDGKEIFSDFSSPVYFEYEIEKEQFSAPHLISIENNIITWSCVPNAVNYVICIDGEPLVYPYASDVTIDSVCKFDFSDLKYTNYYSEGTHNITIYVESTNEYLMSEHSNAYNFNCSNLAYVEYPSTAKCQKCGHIESTALEFNWHCSNCGEELYVSWNKVDKADFYFVEIRDGSNMSVLVKKFKTETYNNSFKFSDYEDIFTSGHSYFVSVVAMSNSMNFVSQQTQTTYRPQYSFS